MTNAQRRDEWWRFKVAHYRIQYFASGPVAISPVHVHHAFSAVFETGVRTFAFLSRADRDLFVRMYRSAQVCRDPRAENEEH